MPASPAHSRSIALVRLLIEDVIGARQRLETADTQSGRRDVVRASLAAIEGELWLVREHVRDSLGNHDELTPLADLALREQVYVIADNGRLLTRQRSVPLPTAIRLVAAQAQIICPDLAIDFTTPGWLDLQNAVAIRNRITHPRPEHDLDISDDDLRAVSSGLFWLVATADYIFARLHLALVHHAEQVRDIVDRLLAGDPAALAEYQAALNAAE